MFIIFSFLMGFVLFIIIAELIVGTTKDDKNCLLFGGLLSFLFVSITGALIEVNTIAAIIFLIISVFLIFYSISDIIKCITNK